MVIRDTSDDGLTSWNVPNGYPSCLQPDGDSIANARDIIVETIISFHCGLLGTSTWHHVHAFNENVIHDKHFS